MREVMFTVLIMSIVGIPFFAHASVQITEIMYAPSGTDTKHEWVEVCANTSVDLESWKLFEADSNHALTLFSGTSALSSGACAIIADDAATFMADYTAYVGPLFDSVFSLSNTGESLVLRDAELTDVDTVSYTEALGAKDDGQSLQRSGNTFVAGAPTPGTGVVSSDESTSAPPTQTTNSVSSPSQQTLFSYEYLSVEPPQDIFVRVEGDTTVPRGSRTHLVAELYNARGIAETGGGVSWNFGDGTTFEGKIAEHVFAHTGTYMVSVHAQSGILEARDTFLVTVFEPALSVRVSPDKKSITLSNATEHMVNIAGFRMSVGGSYFIFPEHTYVASGDTVFSNTVLKLYQLGISPEVVLYDSSGSIIAHAQTTASEQEELTAEKPETVSLDVATEELVTSSSARRAPAVGLVGTVVHSVVSASIEEEQFVGAVSKLSMAPAKETVDEPGYDTDVHTQVAGAAWGSFLPQHLEWMLALGALALIGAFGVFVSRSTYSVADTFSIEEDVHI